MRGRPLDVTEELLEAFIHSGEVSAYLVSILSNKVWRAAPPNARARTIAATVAHMLSLRRTFARMGGAKKTGRSLDQRTVTRAQAASAFRASTEGLAELFRDAFQQGRARVKGQPRRAVGLEEASGPHSARLTASAKASASRP